MDTVWSVRKAYDEARTLKNSQDQYCAKALAGQWAGLGNFPTELALEALVDVLRGKFKVQTHCYEAVDIDAFLRLANEFQFPVASFHHAHGVLFT
jgi:imidazolonepropionase-like amidohydrolase